MPNGFILTSGLLFCNVFANPPAAYKWSDESNGNITDGQSIQITHSGTYTCNVSNIIRGQCNQLSKSITVNSKLHILVSQYLDICKVNYKCTGVYKYFF